MILRSFLFLGLLTTAFTSCSLSTFEQNSCQNDSDCAGIGEGRCLASGYCKGATLIPVTKALKVGMLYVGPVGDHGWTKAHDDSRQYVLDNMSDVEIEFRPSVSPGDALTQVNELIDTGHNVIIGTSFDFIGAIQQAALTHPEVDFLITSGFSSGQNLGSYFGRMYQVMFQAGVLAARMTTTNRLGIVGPVIIPETVRHVNAFTLGARSVKPNVEVAIEWVGDWFNPEAEAAAANLLLAANVDVVFGHTDTTTPIETANQYYLDNNEGVQGEPRIYTIGYDNEDACTFKEALASTCIASAYWNWGPLLVRILGEMQKSTWEPAELPWDQMKGDRAKSTAYLSAMSVNLVPTPVSIEVEGLVNDLSEQGERGLMFPFRGPIVDNQGGARIAEADYPTDADLLKMCWFVKGVIDVSGADAVVPGECVGDR